MPKAKAVGKRAEATKLLVQSFPYDSMCTAASTNLGGDVLWVGTGRFTIMPAQQGHSEYESLKRPMVQFLPLTTTQKREQGLVHPGAPQHQGESFPSPLQRNKGTEGVGSPSMTHMFQRRALGWLRAISFAGFTIIFRHVPKVTQVTVYEASGHWAEMSVAEQKEGRIGVRRPSPSTLAVTLMSKWLPPSETWSSQL